GCLAHRGFIQFSVTAATDDETPADRLGYRFEYVDGAMPEGLTIFPTRYALPPAGELYLVWDDGVTWNQDAFCFRVAVRAIDQAGNESARSNVVIVGHDGDMTYMHRVADSAYSHAATDAALRQIKVHARPGVTVKMDTVRVATTSAYPGPPTAISDVYDDTTIHEIKSLRAAHIDRIALRYPAKASDIPFELEPYSLTESGRELSMDEVLQLQTLLLDPHSYISGQWTCTSEPQYAITASAGDGKTYIVTGRPCLSVGIKGPGFQAGGQLTREAGALLQAYCEGLFQLPLLK
ncbi:MAG TPA: hypothetical protein VFH88_11600, partial [Candidatus Krumholzibacteria bacterium]|nr:hypothetical protein [Candidatus Krumholzibacteria bacterium]